MKQETFKKLVSLSAVGMTAYTVHCLLQLIPAVRELTNRLLPSVTVWDDAYFGTWFGVLMTVVIMTIVVMLKRGKQDPTMPNKPFRRMTYITAIIAVFAVVIGCYATDISIYYTPDFYVPIVIRIPLMLCATVWLWMMSCQDGIGHISKALRVAAIIGIIGFSVPISRMIISAIYYVFNGEVIIYRSWAVSSWAKITIPAFLLVWYSIELWWQTNKQYMTMEEKNKHFWKKIMIVALCVLALGSVTTAVFWASEWYAHRHRVIYWETPTRYISKHIQLVYGYHGNISFERLRDTRTGEFTTPELNHVFINEYNSEDSLVVFRSFDHKRGYINKNTGKIVIPAQFNRAWNFYEGLAAVFVDGYVWFINENGEMAFKEVFPIVYDDDYNSIAFRFHHGLCVMRTMEGKWGMINTKGEWIVEPIYTVLSAPQLGSRIVGDGTHYGLLDLEGNIILPVEYDDIHLSNREGCLMLVKDGRAKLVNRKLETVEPFVFDRTFLLSYVDGYRDSEEEATSVHPKYFGYQIGEYCGVLDDQGHVIIPAKYEWVRIAGEHLFEVSISSYNERILFNHKGERVK